jgi:hypothetical protein
MNTIIKKHFCALFPINKLALKLYAITIYKFRVFRVFSG